MLIYKRFTRFRVGSDGKTHRYHISGWYLFGLLPLVVWLVDMDIPPQPSLYTDNRHSL